MAIELAALKAAVIGSREVAALGSGMDIRRKVAIGVDLSDLGAHNLRVPGEYGVETVADDLHLPQLLNAINAAQQAGLDFVALNQDFRMLADNERKDSFLDGIKIAGKLQSSIPAGSFLAIEVPWRLVADTLADFSLDLSACRELVIPWRAENIPSAAELQQISTAAVARGLELTALVEEPELLISQASTIALYFNAVRCRSVDIERVCSGRKYLWKEAKKLGKSLPLFLELGLAISASMQAAEERLYLIEELTQRKVFSDISSVVGTVYDAAYQVEKYIGRGVADGIVFRPASLPTDLVSIMRGVLPLLQEHSQAQKDLPLFN